MFFVEYLRISGTQNTPGGTIWPRGHRAGPLPRGPHGGSPPLIPATTHSFFLPRTLLASSNPRPSSSCCHFRYPCSKHLSQNCFGDCSLVCDSSIRPISFCSSALFIAYFCCFGDPVLELACQIYVVPSSFDAWYRL